jgi:hypothetical protein
MPETYKANVCIRELPRYIDNKITAIAAARNCNKWEIVRDALVEYVENHAHELTPIVDAGTA